MMYSATSKEVNNQTILTIQYLDTYIKRQRTFKRLFSPLFDDQIRKLCHAHFLFHVLCVTSIHKYYSIKFIQRDNLLLTILHTAFVDSCFAIHFVFSYKLKMYHS